jgi:hypothetical protein
MAECQDFLQGSEELMVYSPQSGYTGYIVDNQELKWLHNWLHIFESGYSVGSQRLKWLH